MGRGVLLDYATWAEGQGIPVDHFSSQSIPISTLQEIAAAQGTEFKPGDILFVRSGWVRAFTQLSQEQAAAWAGITTPPSVGVESSEKTLLWLWETGFAAVAGDMPGFEAWPCQNTQYMLHEWLLAGWAMPIGEMFDLERLSEECRKRKKWSFFFSSVPLRVGLHGIFSSDLLI